MTKQEAIAYLRKKQLLERQAESMPITTTERVEEALRDMDSVTDPKEISTPDLTTPETLV